MDSEEPRWHSILLSKTNEGAASREKSLGANAAWGYAVCCRLTKPLLEHFTAAQGSSYGVGMGLEEASVQASSHLNPARDFQVRRHTLYRSQL